MATVLATSLAPRADELRREMSAAVSLSYIGHRLGHPARSDRWLRTRVDWLTEHRNFPAPLPSPRPKERRYSRRAVDAWFESLLPPDAPSLNGDASPMAAILDARANNLHQLGAGA